MQSCIEDFASTGLQGVVFDMGVPTTELDFDTAYTLFDQTHCGKATASEWSIAEGVACGSIFSIDLESLDLLARHHLHSPLGRDRVKGFVSIQIAASPPSELLLKDF